MNVVRLPSASERRVAGLKLEQSTASVDDTLDLVTHIEGCQNPSSARIRALVQACENLDHVRHQTQLLELFLMKLFNIKHLIRDSFMLFRVWCTGLETWFSWHKQDFDFGKSNIRHAYSVLRNPIIPLSKLGREQFERYPHVKP